MRLFKITIDTCVIIAGLRSHKGASYKILSNINKNSFRYGLSVPLYYEYEKKLYEFSEKQMIPFSKKEISTVLSAIAYYSNHVPIYYHIRPNLKDENDNMVYECAINYGADFIITFNVKDFLSGDLKPYKVKIFTPQKFLKFMGVKQ